MGGTESKPSDEPQGGKEVSRSSQPSPTGSGPSLTWSASEGAENDDHLLDDFPTPTSLKLRQSRAKDSNGILVNPSQVKTPPASSLAGYYTVYPSWSPSERIMVPSGAECTMGTVMSAVEAHLVAWQEKVKGWRMPAEEWEPLKKQMQLVGADGRGITDLSLIPWTAHTALVAIVSALVLVVIPPGDAEEEEDGEEDNDTLARGVGGGNGSTESLDNLPEYPPPVTLADVSVQPGMGRASPSLSATTARSSTCECNDPPVIDRIEPDRGAVGDWVYLTGAGFGGCLESQLVVLCGVAGDPPKAVRASEVRRYSGSLMGFRVPQDVRPEIRVVVLSPFGRTNFVLFRLVKHCGPPRRITSIRPLGSSLVAGSWAQVDGEGFESAMTVTLGGEPAEWVPYNDTGSFALLLPSTPLRYAPLAITWPDGGKAVADSPIHMRHTSAPVMQFPPSEAVELPEAWAVPPDSVRIMGKTVRDFITLLQRVRRVKHLLEEGDPIPDDVRFDLGDFAVMCRAQDITQQYFFYRSEKKTASAAPLFKAIAAGVWSEVERARLFQLFQEGMADGDVIFYDLHSRAVIGDMDLRDPFTAAFYALQQHYDRHSHSGFYVTREAYDTPRPAIFHGLRTRIKDLTVPAAFAYMPKREVDLAKVFWRFKFLPTGVQQDCYAWYREGVLRRSRQGQHIVNDCADLWDIAAVVTTARKELQSLEGSEGWKLTKVGETERNERGSHALKVMCSGFTASILMEVFKEIEVKLHDLASLYAEKGGEGAEELAAVHIHPSLLLNTLSFSPSDLHRWNIWRDELERPPGVLKVAKADVVESFEALRASQINDVSLLAGKASLNVNS